MDTSYKSTLFSVLRNILLLLCFSVIEPCVSADEVGPYTPEHWSANKQFCVRVSWNWKSNPVLTLKRKSQNGLSTIWRITSPQKAPPSKVYIADDGQYTVLEDEWDQLGFGKALAFINSNGRVLATYELIDILTGDERLDLLQTESNILWQQGAMFFFRYPQRQFCFITEKGSIHVFDATTGIPIEVSSAMVQEIRNERIPSARKALLGSTPEGKVLGIGQVAQLHDGASIPDLVKLHPVDLSAVLKHIVAEKRDKEMATEARQELARLGVSHRL